MVKRGYALTSKFRKIKQFSAFWCILYFNQTSIKFTTNDSACSKKLINNVTLSLTMIKNSILFSISKNCVSMCVIFLNA